MLAAAHSKGNRAMDAVEMTGFGTTADGPASNAPLCKISPAYRQAGRRVYSGPYRPK